MNPDGNRLQNSCSPRHWGHSTIDQVPQCLGLQLLCMNVKCMQYVAHVRCTSITVYIPLKVTPWQNLLECGRRHDFSTGT